MSTLRVESALGCWNVTEWKPAAGSRAAAAILGIWLFEGTTTVARERIFPDGHLEIVVQLDASYRLAGTSGPAFAPLSVGGLRTSAVTIEGPGRPVRVLGLRLRPAGAFTILGTSLGGLTNADYDLADVIGRAAAELGDRCHGARDAAACVRAAADWAHARLASGAAVDPAVLTTVTRIEADGGARALAAIDASAERSRSRFAARFADQIGLAPKTFARIVRFRRALELIAVEARPLGDVAAFAGYYDQAHMNAEFRTLGGLTPRVFRASLRYPDSVSLAQGDTGENFQDA